MKDLTPHVQPGEQPVARSHTDREADGASASPAVSLPVVPTRQGRDPVTGQWLKIACGQSGARTLHALKSAADARDELPAALQFMQRDLDQFVDGCLADEGGEDIPTRRRSLLEYRARVHRRIVQLDAALEERGLVDRRNKLRTAWLSQLAGLIERARQLDQTLGLQRRQKRVQTPDEWLQSLQQDHTPAETEPTDNEQRNENEGRDEVADESE